MDLVERGLAGAANTVFNRYLVETGRAEDMDALAALPLFLSLRAAIRAKVTAARREFVDAAGRARMGRAAQAYFSLALRLIAPPPPRLVAIGGLSGTGKSALARRLAARMPPAPGAVVLRSDIERKRMHGVAEAERLPPEAYTAEATRRVYGRLADKARRALTAGHSVIADAVFARPEERAGIEAVGRDCGVPCHGLFLTADLAVRLARVGGRRGDASDADARVAREQEHYDLGSVGWRVIDAGCTPEQVLAAAAEAVGSSHAS
jgi:predicted kinase